MLGAVIFDFDGVITDTEILHLRSFNRVLEQFNIEIALREYYKEYLGYSDIDCIKAVSKNYQLNLDEGKIYELIHEKSQIFEEIAKSESKIIEGVTDFLKLLKENNVPMAICSGALLVEIELILEDADMRSYFDVIVSAEQVKKGKPDPEGFLLTLKMLNKTLHQIFKAEDCVVIEDSHWGLEAAETAGMQTIAVTNSYDAEDLGKANKIVSKLNEVCFEDLKALCE
ncbi:MAG: HAD family hydrolase [Planctomycetota bacterium]|jgi:beta-phosphoglucomutase